MDSHDERIDWATFNGLMHDELDCAEISESWTHVGDDDEWTLSPVPSIEWAQDRAALSACIEGRASYIIPSDSYPQLI